MLTTYLRQTIHCLYQSGKSYREIERTLKISRNTIKKVLKEGMDTPVTERKKQKKEIQPHFLQELFTRCRGNAVRIKEVLKEEYDVDIGYTTLKTAIRKAELRQNIQRVGEYCFSPGEEMQHDTSPHWVILDGKKTKAQCASLILGYSRKLFIQYYLHIPIQFGR